MRLDKAAQRRVRRAAAAYSEGDGATAHQLATEARALRAEALELHAAAAERIEKELNSAPAGDTHAPMGGGLEATEADLDLSP